MRSMRPISMLVLLGTLLAGASACTSVLLNTPVSKTADGWALTLVQLKQGPNEYVGEGVVVDPGPGENLLWAQLSVRNAGAQAETFTYDQCILDGPVRSRQPLMVDRNDEGHTAVDRSESFAPGQERTRLLLFAYAKDQRPAHMKCGNVELAIPAPR